MNARRPRPDARLQLRIHVTVLGALLCAAFALFSGCGLSTGGIPAQDGGAACTTAAQCDDKDPCTTDSCSATGICVNTPLANGPAPAMDQPQGNCQQIVCTGGKASSVPDDSNPPTSTNDCVTDSCSAGKPVSSDVADGTTCTLMGAQGTCMAGACAVRCTSTAMCPSTNPCETPSCDGASGTCVYTNVSDGTPTPGVTPAVGTCHTHVCVGGVDTNSVDNSNVPTIPAAMAGCTDAVCTAGTPSTPFHPSDSVCSTYMGNLPGVCNATGECVQCVGDGDCPGVTDDCQHPSCTNALCGTTFTAAGTATTKTPVQVSGDCHKTVCLGMEQGNTDYQTVVDDSDPPSSGSKCITDTCSGGNVVANINPNVTTIACGMSGTMTEYCNAQGQCGCQSNADCTLPSTCGGDPMHTSMVCGCTPTTCGALGKTCGGPFSDACYGMLSCDNTTQDGNETDVDCGGNVNGCATRCANGKKCKTGSDCASTFCADGVCCNSACTGITCQACSDTAKGTTGQNGVCGAVLIGKDPHNDCAMAAMSTCGDSGGCNGSGACSVYAPGTVCAPATCSGSATLTKASTCPGNGAACMGNGTQSCAPGTCSNNACSNGCSTSANCDPSAYCNAGTCTPKLGTGLGCTSGTQCTSGNCVNSVCCGMASCPQCQACSMALTGMPSGSCANINVNTADPVTACAMQAASTCGTTGKCDGSGACQKYADGTSCANASCSTTAGMSKETLAATCSGGNCSPTMMSCGTYACNGNACWTSCTVDADCALGNWCKSSMCVAKLAAGGDCSSDNNACGAGLHCVIGICCASACSASGTTCGETGACAADGSACVYPSNSTTCAATTCSSDTQTTYTTCNGSGMCSGGSSTMSCSPYACNGAVCGTTCTNTGNSQSGCTTGYFCTLNTPFSCTAELSSGTTCTHGYQCVSPHVCNAGSCM